MDDEYFQQEADCFLNHWIYPHYEAHLRGGVFHSTPFDSFRKILEDGHISPSSHDREFTYPQTDNSYALHNKSVSLLDFRRTEQKIIETFDRWNSFVTTLPLKVLIQLDEVFIDERITRHEDLNYNNVRNEQGGLLVWIPYVEAWYPDKIPLQHMTRLFLVRGGSEMFRQIESGEI